MAVRAFQAAQHASAVAPWLGPRGGKAGSAAGAAARSQSFFRDASLCGVRSAIWRGVRPGLSVSDLVQFGFGHLHDPDLLIASGDHVPAQLSPTQPMVGGMSVDPEPCSRFVQRPLHSTPGSRGTLLLQIGRADPSLWRNVRRWIMDALNAARLGGRQPAVFNCSAMAAAEQPCWRRDSVQRRGDA